MFAGNRKIGTFTNEPAVFPGITGTEFLVEALILALIGGMIGMLAGVAGSRIISNAFSWPTRVSSNAILLAFGFSAAIGIFFGFYPASKAATLDPIDALRYE